MELTWLMKIRIAAVAVVGVVLIGIISWPWESPPDPFGSLLLKEIGTNGAFTLLIMAFLAGLISYFAAWPYGREIGILAVPFGLSIWAVRAGTTGALMQLNPTVAQRQDVLAVLKWEPVFWLLVFAAGFGGVLLGQRIASRIKKQNSPDKIDYTPGKFLIAATGVLLSAFIAIFCIRIFARDIGVFDNRTGSVVAQPAIGQIVYAVLLSFGIAAFVVKIVLDISYIWPIITCAFITAFSISTYMKPEVLGDFVENWPAAFFSDAVVSILPVQIVTFGTIGSIIGYWMAVRYRYWRKHEM